MKATDVIRRDHEAAKKLFAKYKDASSEGKEEMERDIFAALTTHERMEDKHFYPALRDHDIEDGSLFSDLSIEQKKLEAEVLAARALPSGREERILGIMDDVLAHAGREEATVLPQAEKAMTDEELEELGAQMEPDSAVANEKK